MKDDIVDDIIVMDGVVDVCGCLLIKFRIGNWKVCWLIFGWFLFFF